MKKSSNANHEIKKLRKYFLELIFKKLFCETKNIIERKIFF